MWDRTLSNFFSRQFLATPMMLNRRLFAGALSQPSMLGLLLTILLVALGLRIAWLVFITNGNAINGEGAEYARIAQNLVQGKGYMGIATEGRELMHPPLYPLLIAAISFVTLEFNLAAQVVSLIAGVLLLLPLFGIARDLYGYKVAYIATALAALNPILIKLSATTWVEGLYITLIITGLYFFNRCWLLSRIHYWVLAGSFFGLAYLTRPEAILFPLVFLVGLFLYRLLDRAKEVINFRMIAIFLGSFLVLALPYITFLSISTGTLRFEGKTLVNNVLGQRLLSGVSDGLAGYEVTESLEEKGVWMKPNTDFGKSSGPASYRTTLQIMLSRGVKNLKNSFVDILSKVYLGAPLLFPLAVLGFFTGSWSPSRLFGELVLMLALTASMLPMTTIIHNLDSRYYYIVIPILLLWASKGANELPRCVQGTILNVLRKTPSTPICAQAVAALTLLGFVFVFAIGAVKIYRNSWEFGAISLVTRRAGDWLATIPGSKTVMDTGTALAFHAGAKYVPMPFCDSRTALKYAEMKKVNFLVIRDHEAESRPYMREWLVAGIPSPHATLAYVSAVQPNNRVLIFRLDKSDSSNLLKVFPNSPNASGNTKADGPLSPHPINPRYFGTPDGRPVYLTGAHTWANLVDRGPAEPLPIFDFDEYLEFLQKNNHNFLRLWAWESARWAPWTTADYIYDPLPYRRSGPGLALDEKPKFDITQFNTIYFDRLRHRVESAAKRGIYVSVMLFNGFSVDRKGYGAGNPWRGHPLNGANNVNGIDADRNHDGQGEEVHTLLEPDVVRIQEGYVQKVVDTVNDLSNVLFEICNECDKASIPWQYQMVEFIKNYEATKPKQHPVGMTSIWPDGNNVQLFRSPADWISPDTSTADFLRSPPPGDGSKIILSDTDHLCGECGDRSWVWKSFTRGHNPIYMDRYREKAFYDPVAVDVRRNLGFAHSYADRINLASMLPMPKLCSSGYCLVSLGRGTAEYLVYSPDGGEVTVDLSSTPGTLRGEWLDPSNGMLQNLGEVTGGELQSFRVPFAGDAVLYLQEVQKDGVVDRAPSLG